MDRFEIPDKKKAIIATTWDYLLKTGLEKASVGDLCRETGIAQSSLYYWFENKDDIWISAGGYGLSVVVKNLFDYTFAHINKVEEYFETLLSEAEKYKRGLRIAVQITLSDLYGERMRTKSKDFNLLYAIYAEKVMKDFGSTREQAELFIYSIIAFVIDYVIWDDAEKTQMLLNNLYNRIIENLNLDLPHKKIIVESLTQKRHTTNS